jgi:putative RNA 2'-phosphotransferase
MVGKHSIKTLSKFIAYVLGRQPDAFGLVPDAEGYVKIKDLLKALAEEEGWGHVRRSHLNEILLTVPNPPIIIKEERIRSADVTHLPKPVSPKVLPKLLYMCIRNRAYPHVAEKGIRPSGHSSVVLCTRPQMAERIGRRSDPNPVLLTVHVGKSVAQQVAFYQQGEALYLADRVPAGCFSGPPLPKQKVDAKKPIPRKQPEPPKPAGSFQVDLDRLQQRHLPRGRKKEISWKKERRRKKFDKGSEN